MKSDSPSVVQKKILALIKRGDTNLPALPVIITQILRAASNPKTSTEELAAIISHDPGITHQLLKLANSVYYGQRTTVDSIKRSISVIGFDEVIGITLGMKLLSTFADKTTGLTLDMKALWIHSIGTATAAKDIATRTNTAIAKKIFIPGLLHDMGKVIFSLFFKDEYKMVRELAMERQDTLYRVEPSVFGMDHAILAGLLMRRWQFPDNILYPCRFHHNPEASPVAYRHHALIVNMAEYLCHKAHIGHSGNPVPVAVVNAAKKTGLNENTLRLIVEMLIKKEEQIKEFFEITTDF
ncbi:putative signal transduction protein [Desulforapulum autotrophicum HRM2]|uniref:Signal transduction protein n=1 Tax=Desulforapulum autotrophicum (strain ATCC 43914 / DSM 3382 / VKM B-1955 / HRM2) TaxID=177437 RepID=C0QLQ0_DESAH|nr:HDOD domain-containing protein [Desulforapulum autotrophicum]ACN16354.1 putative signal transduction protein [Desulforapulum autotrophicum HRM2]